MEQEKALRNDSEIKKIDSEIKEIDSEINELDIEIENNQKKILELLNTVGSAEIIEDWRNINGIFDNVMDEVTSEKISQQDQKNINTFFNKRFGYFNDEVSKERMAEYLKNHDLEQLIRALYQERGERRPSEKESRYDKEMELVFEFMNNHN